MWLAENILPYISGTKIFPDMGFVQEHNKWYKSHDKTNSDQIFQ